MNAPKEFIPAIEACLQNAERMIAAEIASAVPGSYHIAFHLTTMALEEIGKSSHDIFRTADETQGVTPGANHSFGLTSA